MKKGNPTMVRHTRTKTTSTTKEKEGNNEVPSTCEKRRAEADISWFCFKCKARLLCFKCKTRLFCFTCKARQRKLTPQTKSSGLQSAVHYKEKERKKLSLQCARKVKMCLALQSARRRKKRRTKTFIQYAGYD